MLFFLLCAYNIVYTVYVRVCCAQDQPGRYALLVLRVGGWEYKRGGQERGGPSRV